MSIHVHGTIVTQYGVAANNRGETEGNMTTLQKILWKQLTHTTVSAEAIRYALRLQWQHRFAETQDPLFETNRVWDPESGDAGDFRITDQSFSAERFIDDDAMGYMDAKAPKEEANVEEQVDKTDKSAKKKSGRVKGSTTARRGPLEVARAVSLHPFNGETTFNARGGQKGRTSIYATEVHATAYQYSFSVTPAELRVPRRIEAILSAFSSLDAVGGNHGRFLYDFSPALCIYRLTADPAPRILYVADAVESQGGAVSLVALVRRIEAGDIEASEVTVGGELLSQVDAQRLRGLGARVFGGVKAATEDALQRLKG